MRVRTLEVHVGLIFGKHLTVVKTKRDRTVAVSFGVDWLEWGEANYYYYFFACSKRLLISSQLATFHQAAR